MIICDFSTILGGFSSRRSFERRQPRESIIIQVINVPSFLLPHPRPPTVAVGPLFFPLPERRHIITQRLHFSPRSVRPQRMHDSDARRSTESRNQTEDGSRALRERGGRHAIESQFTCKARVKSRENKRLPPSLSLGLGAAVAAAAARRCLSVAHTPRSSVAGRSRALHKPLLFCVGSNQLLPNKTLLLAAPGVNYK